MKFFILFLFFLLKDAEGHADALSQICTGIFSEVESQAQSFATPSAPPTAGSVSGDFTTHSVQPSTPYNYGHTNVRSSIFTLSNSIKIKITSKIRGEMDCVRELVRVFFPLHHNTEYHNTSIND